MSNIPRVFISYHHKREQKYKEELVELFKKHHSEYFEIKNMSVGLGDIDTKLHNKEIFKIIREKYLKDSYVTILILGKHTKCRQHIDWEIAASQMRYGSLDRRKKNALIILLTDDFIEKTKAKKQLELLAQAKKAKALTSTGNKLTKKIRKLEKSATKLHQTATTQAEKQLELLAQAKTAKAYEQLAKVQAEKQQIDDFIEKAKTNPVFDGKNYSSLIEEKNSGPRIYKNVKNTYASVESFSNILLNPIKLKKMIDESLKNSKNVINPNIETLLNDTTLLKITNEEECQVKCLTVLTELYNSLFDNSKNQIFEELTFEQVKDEINKPLQSNNKKINCCFSAITTFF